jgi:phosphatidylserine/phosphatidylglycerophosphate/cardiolipin synthase-like enzyme
MASEFQVTGTNAAALFTLKLHRGDGMTLIAMNWKKGKPPNDFVGFAIEYKEPGGDRFFALNNRIGFADKDGNVSDEQLPTTSSPIQKFRWVHFPRNANLDGEFIYRVTPMFMNAEDALSKGEPQEAPIELRRETYPGQLNVCFTRGFVSSQAFVHHYEKFGPISKLIPDEADGGLKFKPTHPKTDEALAWMGFEAREALLETLDQAIKDKAEVRVVAYDLNLPDVVDRLVKIGKRLKVIIDDSKDHKPATSAESQAETRLRKSAGVGNVKRQHMTRLQHNKTIVVDGPTVQKVVCGSTNMTWRGLFVQNNNAMVLQGKSVVKLFRAAFDTYFDDADGFGESPPAKLVDLGLKDIDARVAFSPHAPANALLAKIGDDIGNKATSCVFYSLAFLFQTPGPVTDAIKKVTKKKDVFVYGISDRKVGGIDLQKPDGNVAPVFASALTKNVPAPFSKEPTGLAGGFGGTRMHHKFVVIDFDKPSARVYMGSYNFSDPADTKNGENLLLIRDRRIVVSYTIEALRIFDHYHFRVAQMEAKTARKKLQLAKPPRKAGEKPWWDEDFTNARKIRDRELFA